MDSGSMSSGVLPSIEITKHSVDRFSERCLDVWLNSNDGMGLMSYLISQARYAYAEVLKSVRSSVKVDRCRIKFNGIVFVFVTKEGKTSLVTVYPPDESIQWR